MTECDKLSLEEAAVLFEDIVARFPPSAGETLRLVELTRAQFYEYTDERQEDLQVLRRQMWNCGQTNSVRALLKLCEAPRIYRKQHGSYRDGTSVGTCGMRERKPGYYPISAWDRHLGIAKRIVQAKALTVESSVTPEALPELMCSHAGHDKYATA